MNLLFLKPFLCLFIVGSILFGTGCAKAQMNSSKKEVSGNSTSHLTNPYYSRTDTTKLHISEAEWKKVLPADVFEVARHADTERPFTGKYWNYEGVGTYYCAACGNALFKSTGKFASECGWPSFFETIRPTSVTYKEDNSLGMERIEVNCGRCGAHLGHLFDDGPPPTYKRYCMNSIVLDFEPGDK